MFVDLGLLNAFNIDYDTLCRWLLTVKRNYRNETVQYHNWYHAFNVAQMMFCMLTKANWIDQKFQPVSLYILCVKHNHHVNLEPSFWFFFSTNITIFAGWDFGNACSMHLSWLRSSWNKQYLWTEKKQSPCQTVFYLNFRKAPSKPLSSPS